MSLLPEWLFCIDAASCRAALIELGSECTVSGGVEGPSKDERELEELAEDMELDIVSASTARAAFLKVVSGDGTAGEL